MGSPKIEQHNHQGWYNALVEKNQTGQLTLMEDMALSLQNIQNHLWNVTKEQAAARDAQEHLESMLGAMDQTFAILAEKYQIPYPSSGTIRQALDMRRDIERKKLEEEAHAMLGDRSGVERANDGEGNDN